MTPKFLKPLGLAGGVGDCFSHSDLLSQSGGWWLTEPAPARSSSKLKSLDGTGIFDAGVAQLVEQLTCNQQVVGSIPTASSARSGGIGETWWRTGSMDRKDAQQFAGR